MVPAPRDKEGCLCGVQAHTATWQRCCGGNQYQIDSEVVSHSQKLPPLMSELGAALDMYGSMLCEAGEK